MIGPAPAGKAVSTPVCAQRSPTLTISIVNFNTRDLLASLLERLLIGDPDRYRNIVVVDNASHDGSAAMVAERFPDVRLICNDRNRGFGAAHNQLIEDLDSEYWLVLNPDVRLETADIDRMLGFMAGHPRCGIAGCRMQDFDGRLQSSAGQFPFGAALFGWLFNLESVGVRSNLHRSDEHFYDHDGRVDWVSGACMMIRTDVVRNLGGFDERYFLYFEDIDLCYRARQLGFATLLNSSVTIGHVGGASMADPRFDQWLGSLAGSIRFYERHRGAWPARLLRGLTLAAVCARILAYGVLGHRATSRIYCRVLRSLSRPTLTGSRST